MLSIIVKCWLVPFTTCRAQGCRVCICLLIALLLRDCFFDLFALDFLCALPTQRPGSSSHLDQSSPVKPIDSLNPASTTILDFSPLEQPTLGSREDLGHSLFAIIWGRPDTCSRLFGPPHLQRFANAAVDLSRCSLFTTQHQAKHPSPLLLSITIDRIKSFAQISSPDLGRALVNL